MQRLRQLLHRARPQQAAAVRRARVGRGPAAALAPRITRPRGIVRAYPGRRGDGSLDGGDSDAEHAQPRALGRFLSLPVGAKVRQGSNLRLGLAHAATIVRHDSRMLLPHRG